MREVTDYIRSKGMIPGVWLELEVMGINCKKASILPDECFFLPTASVCMTEDVISWISVIRL